MKSPSAASRWNPLRLLLGPIFFKEVIVSGRRRGVYAMRGLYALVLAAVTTIAFFAATDGYRGDFGAAARIERLQAIAPLFGEIFGWMQLVLLTLLGPTLTASAFNEEKTNRTLHSLLSTPLSSAQIVFGKLSSRLLQIVILALIPIPVLLALRLFGGLEAERIIAGCVLAITSAGLSASIGLLLSIFNKRAWSVMVLAIVLTFAIQGCPIIVGAMLSQIYGGQQYIATALLGAFISPFAAFSTEVSGSIATIAGISHTQLWMGSALTTVLLTVGVCLIATGLLRPMMLREPAPKMLDAEPAQESTPAEGRKKKSSVGKRIKRRLAISRLGIVIILSMLGAGFAFFIGRLANEPVGYWIGLTMPIAGFVLDFALPHRRAGQSRIVSDRPVFWRELRTSYVGSRGAAIILGVLVAAILFLAYRSSPIDLPDLHMAILIGFTVVQLLAASTMTTGRIASERDSRTWDTLLCTPMSARRLIGEKLSAAFLQLMPIPTVILAHVVVFMILGALPPTALLLVVPQVLASTFMLSCTGMLLGMWKGKATAVAVMNLSFALLLWIGLPVGAGIASEVFHQSGPGRAMSLSLVINPVFLIGSGIESALSHGRYDPTYSVGDIRVSELEYLGITLASAAGQAAIGLGAAWLSVQILRNRGLRTR